MTLTELQEVLGERVKVTVNDKLTLKDRERENAASMVVVQLAKQMINNADIILRSDKLKATGSASASSIEKLI
jgi:hypothetical protein